MMDCLVRKLDSAARRSTPAIVKKSSAATKKKAKASISLLAQLTNDGGNGQSGGGPVSCYNVDWLACQEMFEKAITFKVMQSKFGAGGSRVYQMLAQDDTESGAARQIEDKEVIEGCLLHANLQEDALEA